MPRTCEAALHVERRGLIVWVRGSVADNRPHAHHALQIAWAAPGTIATVRAGDQLLQGRAVIVGGGVTHSMVLERGVVALLEATSPTARRLRDRYLGEAPAAVAELDAADGTLQSARASLGDGIEGRSAALDPRVAAVLAWLDDLEASGAWSTVALDGALSIAHLSRSRFLHVFASEVGSPWRTYLTWRRALVAITLSVEGANLTQAAHGAGYSDSAHLSRQFVALFGIPPSVFVKNSHFVQS